MIDEKKIELLVFILVVAIIALVIVYITDAYYRRKRKEKKIVYEPKEVEEKVVKPIKNEITVISYKCENCGAKVDSDAIMCPGCGSYFASDDSDYDDIEITSSEFENEIEEDELEYSCEHCGRVVNENDSYCPSCGYCFENESDSYDQVEEIIPEAEVKASKLVREYLGIRALQYFGVVVGCVIITNIFKPLFIAFLFSIFAIICLVTVVEFTFMLLKSLFIDFSYEQSINKIEEKYNRKLSLDEKVDEHIAWLYRNPKKIQMIKNEIVRYYLAKSTDKYLVSEKLNRIDSNI